MYYKPEKGAESYYVNLLISILVHYPEIFTIYYDLVQKKCKLSYMINKPLWGNKYINFKRHFFDSFNLYFDLLGTNNTAPVIKKIIFSTMALLELSWHTQNLSMGEINLINELIVNEFEKSICSDERYLHTNQGELVEYLLPYRRENKEKHLFAFRDAGRVYVYDK
ncbi:MAG: hypothetical protein GX767_00025 [Firmicutes bacterium]|nr:hypothetical protein [Bacillota bacterium]